MQQLNLTKNLLQGLLLAYLYWLHLCKCSSEYELIVTGREINVLNRDSNDLTLNCRRRSDSQDNPGSPFWLNDTQQDIRQILGVGNYIEISTGLSFKITRELEGNYFCGPNEFSTSQQVPLVAYPLPGGSIQSSRITAVAGRDAVLPPLISPGALIQQYFIDWQNATSAQTLARIQGPRDQLPSFEQSMRYSVNPETFDLTIQSVRFEDQGSYLGVIGVREPTSDGQGLSFTYDQTRTSEVMLVVHVPPSFITPLNDQVVSLLTKNSASFTCTVKGYPLPTITWYHNGREVADTSDKYRVGQPIVRNITIDSPFVVERTLTVMNLTNYDSGNVTCVAMVTAEEGVSYVESSAAQLSVLGELADLTTFVTATQGVILRVNLIRALAAAVRLRVVYTEVGTGRLPSRLTTTTKYSETNEIIYIDESVPFQLFRVEVALVAGPVMGPLYHDPVTHDINQPSELIPLLKGYILPYLFATLALLIVCTTVIVGLCIRCFHEQCLACCFKANPPTSRVNVIERVCSISTESDVQFSSPAVSSQVTASSQETASSKIKAKGEQHGSSKSTCTTVCSWHSLLRVVCCLKTKAEEEAREKLEEMKTKLSMA